MPDSGYPASLDDWTVLPGQGDRHEVETTLDGAVASGTAAPFTMNVVSTSNFPTTNGSVLVGIAGTRELMRYDTKTATSFSIVERGIDSGGAQSHSDTDPVLNALSNVVMQRLINAMVNVQTELGVDPAGSDSDVVTRLDGIDTTIAALPVLSPSGVLYGLVPSMDADTDHDINMTAGRFFNIGANAAYTLASELTKQVDAVFAEGDDAGGMFTGTVANNTWYHFILITKDADGTVDWGFDTSATGANAPSGWTARGRLGAYRTDGSANWAYGGFTFYVANDFFRIKDPPRDVYDTGLTVNVFELGTLSVAPIAGGVVAWIYCANWVTTELDQSVLVRPVGASDSTIDNAMAYHDGDNNNDAIGGFGTVHADASSQVQYATATTGASGPGNIQISTIGWVDPRGRDNGI